MKRFSTMSMRPTPCLPLWGGQVTWIQALMQGLGQMPPTGLGWGLCRGTRSAAPTPEPVWHVSFHLRLQDSGDIQARDLVKVPTG